jgi:hypothetical protein
MQDAGAGGRFCVERSCDTGINRRHGRKSGEGANWQDCQ